MNKILKIILYVCIFSIGLNAKGNAVAGLLYDKIFDNKNKAEISVRVFMKQIKDKEYEDLFEIKLYDDANELLKDFQDKKLTNIVVDTGFYFKNKKNINKYKMATWALSQSSEAFEQYYLVKNLNATSSLDNPNIKNIYYNDESQKVWLKYLIYKDSKYKNKANILKKLKKEQRANKNLLEVFFKENSMSVISKGVYETMLNVNPQIKKRVNIIKKSEVMFISAIGFTRNGLSKEVENTINKMKEDFTVKRDDSKVFAFANIRKVYFFEDDNKKFIKLTRFYNRYFELIK